MKRAGMVFMYLNRNYKFVLDSIVLLNDIKYFKYNNNIFIKIIVIND